MIGGIFGSVLRGVSPPPGGLLSDGFVMAASNNFYLWGMLNMLNPVTRGYAEILEGEMREAKKNLKRYPSIQ